MDAVSEDLAPVLQRHPGVQPLLEGLKLYYGAERLTAAMLSYMLVPSPPVVVPVPEGEDQAALDAAAANAAAAAVPPTPSTLFVESGDDYRRVVEAALLHAAPPGGPVSLSIKMQLVMELRAFSTAVRNVLNAPFSPVSTPVSSPPPAREVKLTHAHVVQLEMKYKDTFSSEPNMMNVGHLSQQEAIINHLEEHGWTYPVNGKNLKATQFATPYVYGEKQDAILKLEGGKAIAQEPEYPEVDQKVSKIAECFCRKIHTILFVGHHLLVEEGTKVVTPEIDFDRGGEPHHITMTPVNRVMDVIRMSVLRMPPPPVDAFGRALEKFEAQVYSLTYKEKLTIGTALHKQLPFLEVALDAMCIHRCEWMEPTESSNI